MDPVEIEIDADGKARAIYKDETKPLLDELGHTKIARASNVEWEEGEDGKSGWTVRSAHDPELAIRLAIVAGAWRQVVSRHPEIAYFITREAALEAEVRHFWKLLPPTTKESK
jgi:hypothetical protein